jgi:hypothetical protein
MLLALIGCQPFAHIKGADGKLALIARQQVLIDTGLPRYVFVTHQALDLKLQRLRVKVSSLAVLIEEQSPRQTLHLPALLREDGLNPIYDGAEVVP